MKIYVTKILLVALTTAKKPNKQTKEQNKNKGNIPNAQQETG